MAIECTNAGCEEEATKIMSWEMSPTSDGLYCDFVAPYCDKHADEVRRTQGANFACGPALSEEAGKIDGIRR